jgi:hypothetical protein
VSYSFCNFTSISFEDIVTDQILRWNLFLCISVTENSTVPYYKFGGKSAKIVAFDSADQYVTTATLVQMGNTLFAWYMMALQEILVEIFLVVLHSCERFSLAYYNICRCWWWMVRHASRDI